MKKLLAILIVIITILFCSCSKESKFGIEQFVNRMNNTYDTDYTTGDFLLSKKNDESFLFFTRGNQMLSLSLDEKNNIKEISLLITADNDITDTKKLFCQMCSIFTGNDYNTQYKIFNDSDFFNENIKFTDGNSQITVGRYKYTVVCNSYAITFFCEKI